MMGDDLGYLMEVAARFNRKVVPGTTWDARPPRPGDGGPRPGDAFNRDGPDWRDVLEPEGWELDGGYEGVRYWRRPGKKKGEGHSATTGFCSSETGGDLLYVFSSNAAPFEAEKTYSKFAAYALIYHAGDFSAAARDLVSQGYGEQGIDYTATRPDDNSFSSPVGEEKESQTRPVDPWLPVPASHWLRLPDNDKWILHGYLSRTGVTLLSALWKAGKTTLLAHLLRAFENNGFFCGLAVKRSRVLIVSEESQTIWAERRDDLGLHDHVDLIARPFAGKPTPAQWLAFIGRLKAETAARTYDLIIFDTLSKLWPVREENDAPSVEGALMPLHQLTDRAAVLLVHHLRKGDGGEATGHRGSGGLPAFVETIIELRRYNAADRKNRRRVLSGYGRFRETPDELVIELTPEGYTAVEGDRNQAQQQDVTAKVLDALPATAPGLTVDQISDRCHMTKQGLLNVLFRLFEAGEITRTGTGRRGDPYLYRRPSLEDAAES
jgi:hypothetical protein